MRIIFETEDQKFRIVEHEDQDVIMEDLKGDCFNPKHNPDVDPEKLKEEEKHFENLVNREGVFGYVLEQWNPEPGKGYEHLDSCWGFVGQFNESEETFNHYIIEEMKNQIKSEGK